MSTLDPPKDEWYFNIRTAMVEHGRLSPWEDLMGPYESSADAARALEIAEARNADWDDEDAEWANAGWHDRRDEDDERERKG